MRAAYAPERAGFQAESSLARRRGARSARNGNRPGGPDGRGKRREGETRPLSVASTSTHTGDGHDGGQRHWSKRPETGRIGERSDADAGLQDLNARDYDPVLGLFLQPDWFEVTKKGVGTNRYAYSFNDPVNLRDANGNCVWDACIVESLVLAGIGVIAAELWSDASDDSKINGTGAINSTAKVIANSVRNQAEGSTDSGVEEYEVSGSDLVDEILGGHGGRTEDPDQRPRSAKQYIGPDIELEKLVEEIKDRGIELEEVADGVYEGKLPTGETIRVRDKKRSNSGYSTIDVLDKDKRKKEETRLEKPRDTGHSKNSEDEDK